MVQPLAVSQERVSVHVVTFVSLSFVHIFPHVFAVVAEFTSAAQC